MATRVCKRVPLDFKWELGRVWKGYLCPIETHECPECQHTGLRSPYREYYMSFNHGYYYGSPYIQHPYFENLRYNPRDKAYNLTQEEIDYVCSLGLSKSLDDFIHNLNHHITIDDWKEFMLRERHNDLYWELNDILLKWMYEKDGHQSLSDISCECCHGEGIVYDSEEDRITSENWEPYEPPLGEGYQMWETTSEGSPQTPVFATPEELAHYCEEHLHSFAHIKETYETWLAWITEDTQPTIKIAENIQVI